MAEGCQVRSMVLAHGISSDRHKERANSGVRQSSCALGQYLVLSSRFSSSYCTDFWGTAPNNTVPQLFIQGRKGMKRKG